MNENPLKNKHEKLNIKVEIADSEKDWQICKELRLESIDGPDAEMLGFVEKDTEAQDVKIAEHVKTKEKWMEETNSKTMFSVLAWADSRPVGLGRVRKVENLWRVRNDYVRKEFRNRGIQPKMIALRLREIIRRGGVLAITNIRTDNLPSLRNAEKFGFKVVDTEGGWHRMESDLTLPEVVKKINEALNAG